jgi:DNA processing protein
VPRRDPDQPKTGASLTDAERIAALRLIRSENVGPVTFRELLKHYGSAEAALAAVPELSRRGGYRRAIRLCPREEAEAELRFAHENGAQLLFVGEASPGRRARSGPWEDAPPSPQRRFSSL